MIGYTCEGFVFFFIDHLKGEDPLLVCIFEVGNSTFNLDHTSCWQPMYKKWKKKVLVFACLFLLSLVSLFFHWH